MNQILDTGEEQFKNNNINYGNYNQNKKQKIHKEKSVIEINKIVIFFAISILILGICIIGGSIYSKDKVRKAVEESAKPVIDFYLNEEDNSVNISVQHQKGIAQVSYILNDEEEKTINGNNEKNLSTTIKLSGGKNKIVVVAVDVNNHTVEYEHEYVIGNLAEISLENVDNAVKMTINSVEKIKTITYNWDDGENTVINVDSTEYTGKITAPKGKHTLKITVLDEKNVKTEKTQVVIGTTAPKIDMSLTIKENEYYCLINITDETNIKNVKITLDGEEKVNTSVNSTTYATEIKLKDNSSNIINVEASNGNLTSILKRQRPLPIN